MREAMVVVACYFRGWFTAAGAPGVLLLKWFVNLVFAVGGGLGLGLIFYHHFGHSVMAEAFLEDLSFAAFSEFRVLHDDEIRRAVVSAAPIGILYIVVSMFLTGGILFALEAQDRTKWADFFSACGKHFGSILAITLMTAILVAVFLVLPYKGFDWVLDYLTRDASSTLFAFYYTWVTWFALFIVASWVLRVHDYARVLLVAEPRRNVIATFFRAMGFTYRHGTATLFLWLAFTATPALFLFGYLEAVSRITGDTIWHILLAFAVGQLLVLLRLFCFMARLSGQIRYLSAHPPLSLGPEDYVLEGRGLVEAPIEMEYGKR